MHLFLEEEQPTKGRFLGDVSLKVIWLFPISPILLYKFRFGRQVVVDIETHSRRLYVFFFISGLSGGINFAGTASFFNTHKVIPKEIAFNAL